MAKTPYKMPKPATPKAEIKTPPLRTPIMPAGGKDIISITTKMRETRAKKGKY
jgi:hypothetical protein